MKSAIVIISDPKTGTDEAIGRLLNGLIFARESIENGDEVAVTFVGPGTRWPAEVTKPGHPANELYNFVRPHVIGASRGCAAAYNATESVKAAGVALLEEYKVAGFQPVSSLRQLAADGYQVTLF